MYNWLNLQKNGGFIGRKGYFGAKSTIREEQKMSFDVIEELSKYQPFDDNEARNITATLDFVAECGNLATACDRYGGSHLTAGVFVVDRDGRILLNHHKKAGLWIQFGGHCDNETDIMAVALREAMEETGISRDKMRVIKEGIFDCAVYNIPANRTKGEPAHMHYDINFLVMVSDTTFHMSSESTELRWCTPSEALELIAGDEALIRMIKKSRKYFE